MERNLGRIDRIARFFIGFALIFAPLTNTPPIWASGALAGLAMAIGAVLIVTSFIRFCPLYRLFGISTCKI